MEVKQDDLKNLFGITQELTPQLTSVPLGCVPIADFINKQVELTKMFANISLLGVVIKQQPLTGGIGSIEMKRPNINFQLENNKSYSCPEGLSFGGPIQISFGEVQATLLSRVSPFRFSISGNVEIKANLGLDGSVTPTDFQVSNLVTSGTALNSNNQSEINGLIALINNVAIRLLTPKINQELKSVIVKK